MKRGCHCLVSFVRIVVFGIGKMASECRRGRMWREACGAGDVKEYEIGE